MGRHGGYACSLKQRGVKGDFDTGEAALFTDDESTWTVRLMKRGNDPYQF
jgi:hypothetical protein